ncbi:MAG: hypothetical protein ACLFUY_03180 [Desulfobacterales bacterium]
MTDQAAKPTALVTGGAQGIGRAIAEQFLADGGMTRKMIYAE